jgi:ABC-2 type transport system ATP-binding protein
MAAVIEVSGISKSFKAYDVVGKGFLSSFRRKYYNKKALNNVSFSVGEGELIALLGRNGSGKSTLIKILTGILFPDKGEVSVLGFDPWNERIKLAEHIGVVLGAHGQLFWDLPPLDAFEFMRKIYHVPRKAYERRLNTFLDALEIRGIYKRQVRTLSLGEQMKCNFVASVLHGPQIVFLDEPTIGVDLISKAMLTKTIIEMNKGENVTFVLTTHIVEDIAMAKRILILNRGSLVFDDRKEKLEGLFGDRVRIDLQMTTDVPREYARYGRILEKGRNYVRLEVSKKTLKKPSFIKLLSSKNVVDYRVSEIGLTNILMKLYSSMREKRGKGGGGHV